jgi:hypothetical protein
LANLIQKWKIWFWRLLMTSLSRYCEYALWIMSYYSDFGFRLCILVIVYLLESCFGLADLGLSLGDCICVQSGKAPEIISSGSQGCLTAPTSALSPSLPPSLSIKWYMQFFVLINSLSTSCREKLASDCSRFLKGGQESTKKLCKMKGILPLLCFI